MRFFRLRDAAEGRAATVVPVVTRQGTHTVVLRMADTFWRRFRGLMLQPGLPAGEGLLITRCASVHTAFIRFALDLVYLDATGRVVRCREALRPWRFSWGGSAVIEGRRLRATHCVELAAGMIARLQLQPGDRIQHPALAAKGSSAPGKAAAARRERGAAMVEFVVVGPMLTVLGLAIVQYGMLFFAKNQINYATFMAARAGSTNHASMTSMREAYARNLVALYGGGTDATELNESLLRAEADTGAWADLTLLNPTKESYDDWNDPVLEQRNSARTIANTGLALRNDLDTVGAASGQNRQDANLIKVRVMHGYEPKVPLMRLIYTKYLQWLDPRTDARYTQMVNAGRIPIVSQAVLQMQSDPIEGNVVSSPGPGNGGTPTDPGDPPVSHEPPPQCGTAGCTVPPGPPPCNSQTDPNGCRPPGCQQGDSNCDPECGKSYCCIGH